MSRAQPCKICNGHLEARALQNPPPPCAPASHLWGSHCLRVGVMQLVQGSTKILLEHREPSSAKIPLHFFAQSAWKTGEERKGKESGSAPLLAGSGWLQPLPSLPCCLCYLKAWMRVQAARLLWDNKAQKSPSTNPCEYGNKEHQFSS